MRSIIVLAVAAATGLHAGHLPPRARHATAHAPCSLPGIGLSGRIPLAKDIGDSGKRPAPKDAKALFKRSTDVLRAWSPDADRIFAADTAAGTLAVAVATSDPVVIRVPLSGRGAGRVSDAISGCAFVSVPERGEIVAIDPGSATITRTFSLAGESRPGAMLLDAADRLLIVAGSASMEVVNLKTMEVMDVAPTDAPVRAMALDSAWHRVYTVTQDGHLSGYDLRRSRLVRTGILDQIAAADIAVDGGSHAMYVTLAAGAQRPSLRILQGIAPAAPRCVFHHSVPGSPCLARYAPTR